MIYLENILIFLSAPFFIGIFLLQGEARRFILFFLLGLIASFLSAYVNSFVVLIFNFDSMEAVIKITPMIEELLKSLPLIFYMIIFSPKSENIFKLSVAIGIGFATFENCCYVVNNGADTFYFVLIRGFSAGIMHILCAVLLGFALGKITISNKFFYWVGIYTSIAICITYHAIYNLLVSFQSNWQLIGYFMPIVTVAVIISITKLNIKK